MTDYANFLIFQIASLLLWCYMANLVYIIKIVLYTYTLNRVHWPSEGAELQEDYKVTLQVVIQLQ